MGSGYDPSEWARERREKLAKAAKLREERRKGPEPTSEHTFQPKLVARRSSATSRVNLGPPRKGSYNLDDPTLMAGAYPPGAARDSIDDLALAHGANAPRRENSAVGGDGQEISFSESRDPAHDAFASMLRPGSGGSSRPEWNADIDLPLTNSRYQHQSQGGARRLNSTTRSAYPNQQHLQSQQRRPSRELSHTITGSSSHHGLFAPATEPVTVNAKSNLSLLKQKMQTGSTRSRRSTLLRSGTAGSQRRGGGLQGEHDFFATANADTSSRTRQQLGGSHVQQPWHSSGAGDLIGGGGGRSSTAGNFYRQMVVPDSEGNLVPYVRGANGRREEADRRSTARDQQPSQQRQPTPVSYRPHEAEVAEADAQIERFPCPDCGRRFSEVALDKHTRICSKVFGQKRKEFDSSKMRSIGGEVPSASSRHGSKYTNGTRKGGGRAMGAAQSKPSKWRAESEAFREAIRAARSVTRAEKEGRPLPPPRPSAPDPSLVPCPNCGRTFNEMAAERHIPKCKNIIAQPKSLQKGSGRGLGVSARKAASSSSRRGF